jgi:hypothetical protein
MTLATVGYLAGAVLCIGLLVRWAWDKVQEFNRTMDSFHNYGD